MSTLSTDTASPGAIIDALPLFPLNTVLFPDGRLPLRVFEKRYVDMVRNCMRDGTPFGVCLISSGEEVARAGHDTVPEEIGCLAQIVDCNMEQLGVLLIETRGRRRFRVLSHSTRDDGLLVAQAEVLPDDVIDCKLELLSECLEALRRIVASVHSEQPDKSRLPFAEPYLWDDPSWVANRLCELLPVPLKAKQMLMALPDAGMRIEIVHRYMRQHHIV
ncbi:MULTISPECIES: LON peptidase substrate-binding domain-containing protein [unclassified Cupriavidus]|jgi:Lon protease-like protein|uniref:LON peptidase substrate-binding domain-containing protein n=1 Tax=unclassified Cupriavidus TaxID=2640874 RepID=UPI001C008DEA|nr:MULTISPECIES: LON peptidase substrate-binding domain-containing protein [unclassified Cupriavidus]MCA3183085.1 LON peptidase substrate-binding domain-containing protein [Cupriavidus sp.]MCA3190397.1 LON peptidase substrate-binding domain-containing protein [Cupriavidus sp.]MCA3197101.1 LON peptidase substrate-binding domain-containing protein [Cupriavidus sp.]MCA3202378.1 LON peptidase substrate-binding domain-containing protein [Cupriavidus sp.]MCA3205846.1 LON peptidase substrate-binding 